MTPSTQDTILIVLALVVIISLMVRWAHQDRSGK